MKLANPVMLRAGYAPSVQVAKAIGKVLSTVHRMVSRGEIRAMRDGNALYIDLTSLEQHFRGNGPMLLRVKELRRWVKERGSGNVARSAQSED